MDRVRLGPSYMARCLCAMFAGIASMMGVTVSSTNFRFPLPVFPTATLCAVEVCCTNSSTEENVCPQSTISAAGERGSVPLTEQACWMCNRCILRI